MLKTYEDLICEIMRAKSKPQLYHITKDITVNNWNNSAKISILKSLKEEYGHGLNDYHNLYHAVADIIDILVDNGLYHIQSKMYKYYDIIPLYGSDSKISYNYSKSDEMREANEALISVKNLINSINSKKYHTRLLNSLRAYSVQSKKHIINNYKEFHHLRPREQHQLKHSISHYLDVSGGIKGSKALYPDDVSHIINNLILFE